MPHRQKLSYLLLVLLLTLGIACRSEEEALVVRLGHGLDPSHPVHQAVEHMAERLAAKSEGAMVIDIYPSGQLGTERQLLELLQIRTLDMAQVSSVVLKGFSPLYKVFSLPYVFEDDAHRHAVMEGPIGRKILRSSQDVGMRGLNFYDAGTRSFYTANTPIREPKDVRGLKIRTLNGRVVNQMGGVVTPISFSELYTALQQGIIDGAENNLPGFYRTHHYELSGYYSLDEHTAPQGVLLVSTHLWKRLSQQERTWLQEAANESARYQKKRWAEATEEALAAVEEAGVEIIRPDRSKFVEAVAPLYNDYKKTEPQLYTLYEEIANARTFAIH